MLKFAPLLGCYSLDVDRGNLCFHLFIYPSYVDLPLLCWFLKANGDFFFLANPITPETESIETEKIGVEFRLR